MKKLFILTVTAVALTLPLSGGQSNVAELTDIKDALAALVTQYSKVNADLDMFKKNVASDDEEFAKRFNGFVAEDIAQKKRQQEKLENEKRDLEERIKKLEAMNTGSGCSLIPCEGDPKVNRTISDFVAHNLK